MTGSGKKWERLWVNARLATMAESAETTPYGALKGAAIAAKDGRIAFVGSMDDLPGPPTDLAEDIVDAEERWITPGLIDCHTHIVFGGNRADEFEARLGGASYEDIARAGGGILSTVRATRAASEDDLVESATPRIADLVAEGVTTIEIKSGYGLDVESEVKMLRAARRLGSELPVRVRTTFLGAHTVPPEFAGNRAGYVSLLCDELLPLVAESGLADAVDAFCEGIAFSPEEAREVFSAARDLGLPVKLHADQLSNCGGASLAANFGALSADHLEHASEAGLRAMAAAGTVAVLLPGAWYSLGMGKKPPVDAMRKCGLRMALASDANPGSSPARSLRLMLNMACTLFGLTAEEALAGVTRNAARALGLADDLGTLEVGKRADLAIWDVGSPAELVYWIGGSLCRSRVLAGVPQA